MDNEIIVEAYVKKSATIFKNIIELLSQITPIKKCDASNRNIKQIFLKMSESAISINTSSDNDIQVYINLDASKFCNYKYIYKYPDLNIGVNANIFKTSFKYAKRSEGIILRVRKTKEQLCPSEIEILICTDDANYRVTTIKFNIIQNIISPEKDINSSQELITITNQQFLGICKEMGSKKLAKIQSKNKTIVFSNNEADVAIKWIPFETSYELSFSNHIKAEYIKNITKLATFNDILKIYKADDTIVFKSSISKCITKLKNISDIIGTITITIKLEEEDPEEDNLL